MQIKTNTANYLQMIFERGTATKHADKQTGEKSMSVEIKCLQAALEFSLTTGGKVPGLYANFQQSSSINSFKVFGVQLPDPLQRCPGTKIGHIPSTVETKLLMLTFCEVGLTHTRTHRYRQTPCGRARSEGSSNLSAFCHHAPLSLCSMTCTQTETFTK